MSTKSPIKRIGFHYIQDTHHFRKSDLETWLPILISMDVGWLVLKTPIDRAIPEAFLKRLLSSQVEPVLHFQFSPEELPDLRDFRLLLNIYGKWGVRYITFFHKPNLRSFWKPDNWTKVDLVERFLDIYLPLAEICLEFGLVPFFPPLEPGGDYWDTVFLKTALQGIKRRSHSHLLDNIVIGAIARTNGRHLNWGAGGPERWPNAIPYNNSKQGENHLGFRIFDWYQALIQSCLVRTLPIFLFEVYPCMEDEKDLEIHTQNSMAITRLLASESLLEIEPIPPDVIGAAFWKLATLNPDEDDSPAWFQTGGRSLPIVSEIQGWAAQRKRAAIQNPVLPRRIKHYLLLPGLENSDVEIDIDFIRPLIQKFKPTIGFSIDEAKQADRVTIINLNGSITQDTANQLRNVGCLVQQIDDMAQLLHL